MQMMRARFLYEGRGLEDEAVDMARMAFDNAIMELDSITEDNYVDATLIMQFLRDDLTFWVTNDPEPNDQEISAEPGKGPGTATKKLSWIIRALP